MVNGRVDSFPLCCIWAGPNNHRINLVLHQEVSMNPWVFFNNFLFGYINGLTMGFVRSSIPIDTGQPAYITAGFVGNIMGWMTVLYILFYLINSGVLN